MNRVSFSAMQGVHGHASLKCPVLAAPQTHQRPFKYRTIERQTRGRIDQNRGERNTLTCGSTATVGETEAFVAVSLTILSQSWWSFVHGLPSLSSSSGFGQCGIQGELTRSHASRNNVKSRGNHHSPDLRHAIPHHGHFVLVQRLSCLDYCAGRQ